MTTDSTGKGRPTPKRKDAQAKVKVSSLSPVVTKEQKRTQKLASRQDRVNSRAAYLRGEEGALPLRDRGSERRFVRNYVDARRSIGEYFLPIIFVVLVLTLIPSRVFQLGSIFIMYAVLLTSVVDGFFLSRTLKKVVAEKFPGSDLKGIGMYGWLRSTQMRRMRTPKPAIKRGDSF